MFNHNSSNLGSKFARRSIGSRRSSRGPAKSRRTRRLGMESLERRQLLSAVAAGLAEQAILLGDTAALVGSAQPGSAARATANPGAAPVALTSTVPAPTATKAVQASTFYFNGKVSVTLSVPYMNTALLPSSFSATVTVGSTPATITLRRSAPGRPYEGSFSNLAYKATEGTKVTVKVSAKVTVKPPFTSSVTLQGSCQKTVSAKSSWWGLVKSVDCGTFSFAMK
jgi:hypothetical protein